MMATLFQILLTITWFFLLILPPGIVILLAVMPRDHFLASLNIIEKALFSVVIGLTYLAFVSNIFLIFRSSSLISYFASVFLLYSLLLIYCRKYLSGSGLIATFRAVQVSILSSIRRNIPYCVGLFALAFYSIISRSRAAVNVEGLLASDPWLLMGLGKYIRYLGYVPAEFIHFRGVGMISLFGLTYSAPLLDPIFSTKMIGPLLVVPLSVMTVVLFIKRLGLDQKYHFLGAMVYLSAMKLTYDTQITLERTFGFFLVGVSLYAWAFYKSTKWGPYILGIIIGGTWLFHEAYAIPLLIVLMIENFVVTIKVFRKRCSRLLRGHFVQLMTVSFVAMLIASPAIVRIVTLRQTLIQFEFVKVAPNVTIATDWIGFFKDTFHTLETYNTGFIPLLFSILGMVIYRKNRNLKYILGYSVVLTFLAFNPYSDYLYGFGHLRWLAHLAFPIAIFSTLFIKASSEAMLSIHISFRKFSSSIVSNRFFNLFFTIFILSAIISSTVLSYPTMPYFDIPNDADFFKAVSYIENRTSPDPSIKILTYSRLGPKGGFYQNVFGCLSPRTILPGTWDQDVAFLGISNIRDYFVQEKVRYGLFDEGDFNVPEMTHFNLNAKIFGKYIVVWLEEG